MASEELKALLTIRWANRTDISDSLSTVDSSMNRHLVCQVRLSSYHSNLPFPFERTGLQIQYARHCQGGWCLRGEEGVKRRK